MSDMTIQNAIHCMKAMICEEVCEECDYYGKTGTDHCEADAVRMAIKALDEQPHWIPCSERLPEEGEQIIGTFDNGNGHVVVAIDCFFRCLLRRPFPLTAWMPLPEPYKPKEN